MNLTANPCDWVERHAASAPQRIFMRSPRGDALTYEALQRETARWVAVLQDRGIQCGDRIAARVDKSPNAVLLYIACLRMGAVFIPINVASTVVEVEHQLRDSQPQLVVIRPVDAALLAEAVSGAGVQRVETLGADGDGTLESSPRTGECDMPRLSGGGPESAAAIVYTSGTTGRAKGAVLTRANLASNAQALAEAWRFSSSDVLLHALPLFHVHGLFAAINTVLVSGAGMVLLPKFDAPQVLAHLGEASVYMGVPTHYTRLLQERALDVESTASVRLFVSGSAPLLPETYHEFKRRTGHRILERYGMTETLMIASNPYGGDRMPGSVGQPLAGVEVRISDDLGNIEVRGPGVFTGYWRDDTHTRGAFTADGWFKTGDLGRVEHGYLYIIGRAKDLVISGGFNVYPKEVECELDAIDGVLESAVFGIPHPDFGEGVTAAVVKRDGAVLSEAGLVSALKTKLAGYKIPKRIVFVTELPRNTMGKVQKNALRRAHEALYG